MTLMTSKRMHRAVYASSSLVFSTVVFGCHHTVRPYGDGGTDDDGAVFVPDGGDGLLPDGTEPFEPETTYTGEGDACRFSVQCGARQICVDDACVRHERVSADELEHGEWRRLYGTEWDQSALNPGTGHYPWASFDVNVVDALWGPTAWTFPGIDGPQLVVTAWHAQRCQVLVLGATVRIVTEGGLMCTAAAVSEDGRVALAGVRVTSRENEIVLFDRDGERLWKKRIPDALHAQVASAENWGTDAQVGLVSSLRFWGDGLVASAARGSTTLTTAVDDYFVSNTPRKWEGLVFLDVTSDGEMSIRPVAGEDVVVGWKGWIADEHGSLVAFVNVKTGPDTDALHANEALEVLDLETGARRRLADAYAGSGQLLQTRAGYWLYQLIDVPACNFTMIDSEGMVHAVDYNRIVCDYEISGTGQQRGRVLETPWSRPPAPTTNTNLPFVRAAPQGNDLWVIGVHSNGDREPTQILPFNEPNSSIVVSGTVAVSRFGKTVEALAVVPGDSRYLAYVEMALARAAATP